MGATGPETRLAIIAGRGALPRLIAEARAAARLPYLVISFQDWAEDWMGEHPNQMHEFERVGELFASLRQEGCGEVAFAGEMARPRIRMWRADGKALQLAPRLFSLVAGGDDVLLAGLAEIFEEEGFRVAAAEDCLDGLTATAGVLGRHQPTPQERIDAARGARVLAALAPMDAGQAVVMSGGRCLGIEAAEGTDALLARIAGLPAGRRGAPGGVLVKLALAGHDRRAEPLTIGPLTVVAAAAAKLRGIVVEAAGTNILQRDETVRVADTAGLFVWCAAREALRE